MPANLRLSPLPPYCPELNPVERFGGLLKAAVANRLYLIGFCFGSSPKRDPG